jgi:hypothetical protein
MLGQAGLWLTRLLYPAEALPELVILPKCVQYKYTFNFSKLLSTFIITTHDGKNKQITIAAVLNLF